MRSSEEFQVGYEATTAGGVPIIRTVMNLLPADRVQRIRGILNGTSNFILTKMREEGIPFKAALHEAQATRLCRSGSDGRYKW